MHLNLSAALDFFFAHLFLHSPVFSIVFAVVPGASINLGTWGGHNQRLYCRRLLEAMEDRKKDAYQEQEGGGSQTCMDWCVFASASNAHQTLKNLQRSRKNNFCPAAGWTIKMNWMTRIMKTRSWREAQGWLASMASLNSSWNIHLLPSQPSRRKESGGQTLRM